MALETTVRAFVAGLCGAWAPGPTRGALRRVSSPLVGTDTGGASCSPPRQGSGSASDNLLGQRDPPPLPAPTRGGGCANAIDSAELHYAHACLPDVARLENAW